MGIHTLGEENTVMRIHTLGEGKAFEKIGGHDERNEE